MALEQFDNIIIRRTSTNCAIIDNISPQVQIQRLRSVGHSETFAHYIVSTGGMHTLCDVINLGSRVGKKQRLIKNVPESYTFAQAGKIYRRICKEGNT